MTVKKALAAAIQIPGIDDDTLEKGCTDNDLTAAGTYTKTLEKDVDIAAANVLTGIVVSNMQEGGFAFGIDKEALQRRIDYLFGKWGVSNSTQPKVRNAAKW